MKASYIDIISKISGILLIVFIIGIVLSIKPGILTRFLDGLYPLNKILNYEAIYLWRERLFDTIFQGIAILVGLMGVLVYVIWGEKRD